jgi:hypothetical protein
MHLHVFVLIFACYKVAKQFNATIPHGDQVPTPRVVIDSQCPPPNGPQWPQGGKQPRLQGGSQAWGPSGPHDS